MELPLVSTLQTSFIILVSTIFTSRATINPIRSPPDLSDAVQTKFRVPIGSKQFRLICPVKEKDDDVLMIQWKKDDEPIGIDFNNHYKLTRSDRELKIKNPQISDGGVYQCQVINGFGHKELNFTVVFYDPAVEADTEVDTSISLTSNASPPMWKNETEMRIWMNNPVRITLGGILQLRCPAKGNPLPHIIWLRHGMPLESEIMYHPSSAVLHLSEVQTNEGGEYVCRLENEHGTIEATFHVQVENFLGGLDGESWALDQNQNKAQIYPIIEQPFNNTVRVGHTAQFQCKVKNQQQPLIKWLKRIEDPSAVKRMNANATLIQANNMHLLLLEMPESNAELEDGVRLNRLIIPNVRYEHSGTYLCVVTNSHGDIVYRSAHLHVIASDYGMLSNIYFYGGISLLVVVFAVIAYAIYILHKTRQPSKNSDCDTDPPSARRYSFSLRPPPPAMPPPKAPLPLEQQHLMPTNPICDCYTQNSFCYPRSSSPEKKIQKIAINARTTPIRRGNVNDMKIKFPEECAAVASPKWSHCSGCADYGADFDPELIKTRTSYCHNPSCYNISSQEKQLQKPFLSVSTPRR